MGYKAQKEKREEKKIMLKRAVFCLFAFLVLALVAFSFHLPPESWEYYFSLPTVREKKEGELRVHFIDVGQGDCTLIELPDGKVALIDGGDSATSTKRKVMRYLNALDIDTVDYLIVTHTDKDHCGSLTEVFKYKKVVNAYLSNSYTEKDVTYAKVYAAALEEDCEMILPSRAVALNVADAEYQFRFLTPYGVEAAGEYSEESAVLWLEYKGVRFLFCGDMDENAEERLLRDDRLGVLPMGKDMLANTQFLKVAHHGSGTSTSQEFVAHIQAKVAVISCGKDNPYGHPSQSTMERLESSGAKVYRTDVLGDIVATVKSDGYYLVEEL